MTTDDVREIAGPIALQYLDDIEAAVNHTIDELSILPGYKIWCKHLAAEAVRNIIHDVRHSHNVKLKRQIGAYDIAPKVVVGTSEGIRKAYQSAYDLAIGGKSLGSVLGKELAGLAQIERNKADGHRVLAELCETLTYRVSAEKSVREAITEKELRQIIQQAQERVLAPVAQAGD